jgi:hypothetical protein
MVLMQARLHDAPIGLKTMIKALEKLHLIARHGNLQNSTMKHHPDISWCCCG